MTAAPTMGSLGHDESLRFGARLRGLLEKYPS